MVLSTWQDAALLICLVAQVILVIWVYRVTSHYKRLVKGSRGSDLKTVLEHLLASQEKLKEELKKVEGEVVILRNKSQFSIQKVGLVRFSPYQDTGGNQSFTLALLNEKDSGVVILSLHNREGTRIYIKPIVDGASKIELSSEEKRALDEARKGKALN